jgi:hypothetical protein
VSSTLSETSINGHDASKNESVVTATADADESIPTPEPPNLYGSQLVFLF